MIMTPLAPYLSTFLREYLPNERQASAHTIESYAYAFQLLVCFAAEQLDTTPSSLHIEDLGAPLILAFLEHVESKRNNTPTSRNARLAAIKAFFRFIEYRLATCLEQTRRIQAIPVKKADAPLIDYLSHDEVTALINAPDPSTIFGVRDRAMLYLAFAAGLRVSELTELELGQVTFHPHPSIRVVGKGRRERELPLWKTTVNTLRAWIKIRPQTDPSNLFLNARGEPITRSGFQYVLAKYVKAATIDQPSLANKHVSPHVLRHTCAMHMLMATHDVRKVALWLGHARLQSTEVYLRADPTEKLAALASLAPLSLKGGKFRAPDKLLALLRSTKESPHYVQ